MSNPTNSRNHGKIAIPRLERGPPPPPIPKVHEKKQEERAVRACEPCRKRKTRCTGNVPCSHCTSSGTDCFYGQARRDRLKGALERNQRLANLLRDLIKRVDAADRARIEYTLEHLGGELVSQDLGSPQRPPAKRRRVTSSCEDSDRDEEKDEMGVGEALVAASVGLNENLDHVDEDLMRNRESRETGYVGQNSEVQWLSSVQRRTGYAGAKTSDQPSSYGRPGTEDHSVTAPGDALHERRNNAGELGGETLVKTITDASFYLDSDEMKFDMVVDPYGDPEADIAKRLFDYYMETVHESFPLVSARFEEHFRIYHYGLSLEPIEKHREPRVSDSFRAHVNLIFAIGAKYSHLIGADWAGNEQDHVLYMTRAVYLLGLKNSVMPISEPVLETVQATGMLAFYFLAIGYVSRAWITIGLSIRLALALGLHLRNEDPKAGAEQRETLTKTWWALQSLECLVSSITGRPPVLAYDDSTVSLPGEQREPDVVFSGKRADSKAAKPGKKSGPKRQSVVSDRYFSDYVKITIITQKVLINLYSPRTAAKSWEFIEKHMTKALEKLHKWQESALDTYPRSANAKQKAIFDRKQFLLKTEFWSTKMLITRPCLCRLENRIRNESSASARFNSASAEICVDAALEMAKLFPDTPDIDFINRQGAWWSANHLIMQCIAVLLLDINFQKSDTGSTRPNVIASIKKMMHWLRVMKQTDPVSEKAGKVLRRTLMEMAPNLQALSFELLGYDQIPAAHTQPIPQQGLETNLDMQTNEPMSRHNTTSASPVASGTTANFPLMPQQTTQQMLLQMPQHNPRQTPQQNLQHTSQQNLPHITQQNAQQTPQQPLNPPFNSHQFPTVHDGSVSMTLGNPLFRTCGQTGLLENLYDFWGNPWPVNMFDSNWPYGNAPQGNGAAGPSIGGAGPSRGGNPDTDMHYELEN